MFNQPSTKLEVVKFAAQALVCAVVANTAKRQITDHTDVDPESKILEVGCDMGGMLVAVQAKPQTDALVDKAAAWFQSRKDKKDNETPKQ
jgi:cyclopropane fatty-acyl-phospholipid synthase-like methyltransferase